MAARALRRNRVFCIEESVWDDPKGLTDRTSVLPTLETLERMRTVSEFVHRHAVSHDEFKRYLVWRTDTARTRTYGTVYLAFHGTSEGLRVGNKDVSLEELAELLGKLPDGVVHLGSCSVLHDEDDARRFLQSTGARMISGYERSVDWLDSAALDTAWLGYVAWYSQVGQAARYLKERYGSTIDHLKWKAVARK